MKLEDYISAAAVIGFQAALRPTATAVLFQGQELTYAQLEERSSRVAAKLVENGIEPGHHVSILAKNTARYYECLFGIMKAGAIATPLNWRLVADEIDYQIGDAEVKFVFLESPLSALLVVARERHRFQELFLDVTADDGYEAWLESAADPYPTGLAEPDAPILQVYTAGTTGRPKGAMLTNRNFTKFCDLDQDVYPDWWQVWATDISLQALPLFHVGGLETSLRSLFSGSQIVLHREFNAPEVLDSIVRYRPTLLNVVPTVLQLILRAPGAESVDFSCIRIVAYGGSPIAIDLVREALKVMRCGFVQAYGMSETTSTVVGLPPEDHTPQGSPRMLAAGKALPRVEIKVVDEKNRPMPSRSVGEILIRAPSVMQRYWNNPTATRLAIDAEGWLHTGDLGYLDEDEYLYINGRLKDLIISGGENIYPIEVENAIFSHPAVAEVAVIGVPDEKWGEAVKAVVVAKPGLVVDPADIIAWARQRIAGYKAPQSVDMVNHLPKNAAGKVLKVELKKRYAPVPANVVS